MDLRVRLEPGSSLRDFHQEREDMVSDILLTHEWQVGRRNDD